MLQHFGINFRMKEDGLNLTRENYIKVNNKSSFPFSKGETYNNATTENHIEDSLYNYDFNMKYFSMLKKEDFEQELQKFLKKTEVFEEATDLASFEKVPGFYIIVLDQYKQAYIGRSDNIRGRIQHHWSKQMRFDRLIFGSKENSILAIDSFRAYDTTRVFVYPTNDLHGQENDFINQFDNKYLLNRTAGGTLTGLMEAIMRGKTRGI